MRKNLFLRLCLMMIAWLSLNSCRQDLLPEKETYHNASAFQLTSKRISLNESKHKAKLLTELEKAEAEFKKLKTDALGKTVSYGNGVSIDIDNVTYIENGPNYHTYTFTITRENAPADAPLENLVLSPLTDGTYRELLFTYNLSTTEKENIANGIPVDPKGKVSVTELTKGTYNTGGQLAKTSCNWVTTTVWVPCSENLHDASNFHECRFIAHPNEGTPPRVYTIEEYKCLLESDPGPGDGPGGSGTGGGGVGGGEGGTDPNDEPCSGNGVLTEPQQPGLTDPNGCTGIPTMPTLLNLNDLSHCEVLKQNSQNPKFQSKLYSIKTRVLSSTPAANRDQHETMVTVRKQGQKTTYHVFVKPDNSSGVGVEGIFHGYDTTLMHNHPENSIPIFSVKDLMAFYYNYSRVTPYRKNAYTFYLVSFNGTTYALRMEDISALETYFSGIDLATDEGKIEAEKNLLRIFTKDGDMNQTLDYTAEMAEKMLLKTLKTPELGAGNSISLYQNENGVWKKLSLNPDETIQKDPCTL